MDVGRVQVFFLDVGRVTKKKQKPLFCQRLHAIAFSRFFFSHTTFAPPKKCTRPTPEKIRQLTLDTKTVYH